jgi:hypothetical protein
MSWFTGKLMIFQIALQQSLSPWLHRRNVRLAQTANHVHVYCKDLDMS